MFKGNTPLMEGQEPEIAEQPAEIYDMDKGAYVPNPALKKETQDPDPDADPEPDPDPNADPEPEPDADPKPDADADPDPNADPEPDPDPNADPDKDKNQEDVLDPDAYFAEVFGEKYGVKTQAETETLIENALELQDEFEVLKKENETLKAESGKPKLTEKEQKAVDFIKQFDINRPGEALDTYAKLIGMDVDQTDEMLVLEERFVHEHPEYTRQEAQRMFAKQHSRKYNIRKEDFDSEESYNSELEDLKIEKKGEVARARIFLKDKQSTYKPKAAEEKPLVSETVTKSIEKTTPEYTAFVDKTNELTFEQGGDKYIFKLDAEKKGKVAEAVKAWVKNPANYSQDGKLLGIKTPGDMLKIVTGGMYMDQIINAVADQVKNSVNIKRVEEVGKKQPQKRQAPGSGDTNKPNDLYSQAQNLIKKRKAA